MHTKHRHLLAAFLAFAILPAFATSKPPVTPPPANPPGSSSDQKQDQNQGQHQGQGQNQTAKGGTGIGIAKAQGGAGGSGGSATAAGGTGGTATSGSASGAVSGSSSGVSLGDVGSSSAAGAYSGGNSLQNDSASSSGAYSGGSSANGVVSVDAADRSSTSISHRSNVFIPGDLPANAMTIAPGAYITVAGDTECGVLQTKVQVPVYQWNKRGTKQVQVGVDHELAPVFDANGVQKLYDVVRKDNGGYYEVGSHVTYVFSTKGSANSSQLGLQGGGGGGYGGVSLGSGRSYSEAGTHVVIRSCIARSFDPAPVAVAKPAPRPMVRRKPVARRAPAACTPRPATVCPVK